MPSLAPIMNETTTSLENGIDAAVDVAGGGDVAVSDGWGVVEGAKVWAAVAAGETAAAGSVSPTEGPTVAAVPGVERGDSRSGTVQPASRARSRIKSSAVLHIRPVFPSPRPISPRRERGRLDEAIF